MIRSLLVLLLVATQLLAGSGGSVYLCIGRDGTACLDAGPESCTGCHDHDETADSVCAGASCMPSCGHHHHEQSSPPAEDQRAAADPCGCTHIPLMVAASQPTTRSRGSIATETERFCPAIEWAPSVAVIEAIAPARILPHSGPPEALDFGLIVVATVVSRC